MPERRLSELLIPKQLDIYKQQRLAALYGPFIEVRCNGLIMERVVAYNVEAGWVEKHLVRGDKVALSGNTFAIEKIQGNVRLSWRLTGGGA